MSRVLLEVMAELLVELSAEAERFTRRIAVLDGIVLELMERLPEDGQPDEDLSVEEEERRQAPATLGRIGSAYLGECDLNGALDQAKALRSMEGGYL